VLFETGYGPSGLPHIGTFQEVLRTTLVRRAYEALTGGAPTRLVAFSDDMDGLRKVPDNVPNQAMLPAPRQAAEPHPRSVRKVRKLRAPQQRDAARFPRPFGFDYEFVSSSDRYNSGAFDERCGRARQFRRDHGHHAADAARGAPQDLFAGAADQPEDRAVLQVPVEVVDAEAGIVRFDEDGETSSSRILRRPGQAAVEGRLGDALGRAGRRLRDVRQGPDRQRHPVGQDRPRARRAASPKA
jgi:lysyl-tRNA synthetase, class I